MIANTFYDNILPGNYALTKSMELTRTSDSGTLWYTKKYLTLYNFIFLSNDIFTDSYVSKVIEIFDNYIETIDEKVKLAAKNYFYPDNDIINFKSNSFKKFIIFANKTLFSSESEKKEYYNNAKKAYFALLMGTGGQAGVKSLVVNAIKSTNFHYDSSSIKSLILNSVVSCCVEMINNGESIRKGDVSRILSHKAIVEIEKIAAIREVSKEDVIRLNELFPCSKQYPVEYGKSVIYNPGYSSIENDCFASIRNERQILFYYGYFHSKSTGAKELEFSSLTPVGHLALYANSDEFLVLWEHQKLKMISQPATADINNVPRNLTNPEKFSVSFSPYLDILGALLRNNNITLEQYKFIISRRTHNIDENSWIQEEKDILKNLNKYKNKIVSFNRLRDIQDEDSRKEILKYLLGIRADLSLDQKTNYLGMIVAGNKSYNVLNKNKLNDLYNIYLFLNEYKIQKYSSLFELVEDDLRNRYIVASNTGKIPSVSPTVKIKWDLYNIHVDNFICLALILLNASFKQNLNLIHCSKVDFEKLCMDAYRSNHNLLQYLDIKTINGLKEQAHEIVSAIANKKFSNYLDENPANSEDSIASYREESATGLFEKIKKISSNNELIGPRQRNTTLISLLKSYYIARFSNNKLLKCECCGHETFLTNSGEPYLEFHHLIPFNIALGPDHYLNLYALCPNCHRVLHSSSISVKEKEYEQLDENNYLQLSIVNRLKELKKEKILCSYHLEYLLAERAISQSEYDFIVA